MKNLLKVIGPDIDDEIIIYINTEKNDRINVLLDESLYILLMVRILVSC